MTTSATEIVDQTDLLIVLFDGTCGFCDRAVQFILGHDPHKRFRFAPLQSPIARKMLLSHQLDPDKLDSLVVINNGNACTRSAAVLRIALELSEPWPLAGMLIFVPEHLRDAAYDYLARHRKTWFKSRQACATPTPEQREQFLA